MARREQPEPTPRGQSLSGQDPPEQDPPAPEGLRGREARRLALFAPVLLAIGIWIHVAAAEEPGVAAALAAGIVSALAGAAALLARRVMLVRIGALALMALGAGYALAGARIHGVAAPVLEAGGPRGTLAVDGTVTAVDRSASGRARLTLETPRIAGLAADRTPGRIRVTLAGPPDAASRALLWRRVALRARLSAPFGPVEPGGFDPRFPAWFAGLGAIGVARGPVEDLGPAPVTDLRDAVRSGLAGLRQSMAGKARAALGGETGALAAALLVGDRSALPEDLVDALRAANLSHLLAISGLHMGLVCLTVFGALRLLFAFSERIGGRFEPKKVAALGAILAGIVYLALSGGAIATWRAFAMAAVAFGAVLADRPPVTLRAVALAALLILTVAPESLFDIGFQLSFAATTAMVAAFEGTRSVWRARRGAREEGGFWLWRTIGLWALALLVSSLVAGLATAPFAAAAFNRSAPYGLLANMLAMPLMGFWIMPLGVIALVLAPIGGEALALAPMGVGLDMVVGVARWVSTLPGAERTVPAPAPLVIPLLALGGLWLLLWRTRWLRLLGLAPMAAAALLWIAASPRPDLLVGPGGRILGVMGAEGRALDRAAGEGFAAQRWLRADGDPAGGADAEGQAAAAGRGGWRGARNGHQTLIDGWRVRVVFWKELSARDAAALCDRPTLVIAPRASGGEDVAPVSALATALRGAADGKPPSPDSRSFRGALAALWSGEGWRPGGWSADLLSASGWLRLPDADPAVDPARGAPCLVLDRAALTATGALALVGRGDGLRITSATRLAGRRLWTSPALRRAEAGRAQEAGETQDGRADAEDGRADASEAGPARNAASAVDAARAAGTAR